MAKEELWCPEKTRASLVTNEDLLQILERIDTDGVWSFPDASSISAFVDVEKGK